MKKITIQEATNFFGMKYKDENPNINSVRQVAPSIAVENGEVFGAASPSDYYVHITGAGLNSETLLETESGQQFLPNEDSTISEQRVNLSTLSCDYSSGTVFIEGFEYLGSNNV